MISHVHPSPADLVFPEGDLIHLDCGLEYMGFVDDWQKVLREGGIEVPVGLVTALQNANRVHEAFASAPRRGMTAWEAALAPHS